MTKRRDDHGAAWPMAVAIALLLVAVVNGLLVYAAVESDPGRLELHPYEAGLTYEGVLKAKRALDAIGWITEITFQPNSSSGASAILISVRSASGEFITGLTGTVTALYPANGKLDRNAPLIAASPGSYRSELELKKGLWLANVTFHNHDRTYILERSLMVP